MPPFWTTAALILCVSCGGKSDPDPPGDGLAGLTDSELAARIESELDRLNRCATVDDCEPVGYPICGTRFIGAETDRAELEPLLQEYGRRQDDIACAAVCQCGLLRCESDRCVTEDGDCTSEPPGSRQVCL
jgi:hypothetical protein